METGLKEELIIASASKVHEDWCTQELIGFFNRGNAIYKDSDMKLGEALQLACYKGEQKRNEAHVDIDFMMGHESMAAECLLDLTTFMQLVKLEALEIQRYVKRNLTQEEAQKAGYQYRNGEENILRPFKDLSTDSKKENLEAAIGAVSVYEQLSQAGISLEQMEHDPEIKNLIGIAIHTSWLTRNMDHPNESLKVPYDQLDDWTKQQDLTVFYAMLGVVKQNIEKYAVHVVEGATVPDYKEAETTVLGKNGKNR